MFDLAKLSTSNSQAQSLVRDYELFESYQPTLADIQVSWIDSLHVTALTFCFLAPVGAVAWWHGFSCLGIVGVVAITTGAMALRRYDRTTQELFNRQHFSMGRVAWDKNQSSSSSKQKAVVRYVKDTYYTDQGVLSDVLVSEVISHEQLENMAAAVLSSGKFNQDTVCKAAQISASDYGKLAVEMMEQGLINLKGKTAKQGYNITKRGYDCLGHLVTPAPPLLA